MSAVDVTDRLDEVEQRIVGWDFPGARDAVQGLLDEPDLAEEDRLTARRLLAEVLRELGELDAAYDLADAVVSQAERRHGPAHPVTVHAVAVLAAVRHDYDEWDEAERLYHRVLDSGVDEDGDDPVCRAVRLARVNLALLQRDRGNRPLALVMLNAAYVVHRREYGADDLDTIRIAAELGALHREDGNVSAARRLYTVAHASARARLGNRHPFTRAVEWELAAVEPPMPSAPVSAVPAEPPPPLRSRSRLGLPAEPPSSPPPSLDGPGSSDAGGSDVPLEIPEPVRPSVSSPSPAAALPSAPPSPAPPSPAPPSPAPPSPASPSIPAPRPPRITPPPVVWPPDSADPEFDAPGHAGDVPVYATLPPPDRDQGQDQDQDRYPGRFQDRFQDRYEGRGRYQEADDELAGQGVRVIFPVKAVVIVVVLALVLAALSIWRTHDSGKAAGPAGPGPGAGASTGAPIGASTGAVPASAGPGAGASGGVDGATESVQDLRLRDDRTVLTVTWTGLPATVVVALSKAGGPPVVLASMPPGTSEYVVRGVEPGVAYCVVVGSVDERAAISPAASVCTGAR